MDSPLHVTEKFSQTLADMPHTCMGCACAIHGSNVNKSPACCIIKDITTACDHCVYTMVAAGFISLHLHVHLCLLCAAHVMSYAFVFACCAYF